LSIELNSEKTPNSEQKIYIMCIFEFVLYEGIPMFRGWEGGGVGFSFKKTQREISSRLALFIFLSPVDSFGFQLFVKELEDHTVC
jgi:hypothetical protein